MNIPKADERAITDSVETDFEPRKSKRTKIAKDFGLISILIFMLTVRRRS